MKVLVCPAPRQFAYEERPAPRPAPGHALLRVRRIGVCGTDLHAFEGTQPYFQYPRILGHELAADLVDAGEEKGLITGKPAALIPYFSCGGCVACRSGRPNCCARISVFGVHEDGGLREFISVPAGAVLQPHDLPHDALALLEPLAIGAHGVARAGIRAGERVLVTGAGPIGLATIQFAALAGAEVIALDRVESRLAFARRFGAAHTVQAAGEEGREAIRSITGGDMADVVIDATGNRPAIENGFSYLAHGGRYVLVGLQKESISFSHPEFHKREATLMSSRNAVRADFDRVIEAIRSGRIDPAAYITHRAGFLSAAAQFDRWLDPGCGVIKALIDFD